MLEDCNFKARLSIQAGLYLTHAHTLGWREERRRRRRKGRRKKKRQTDRHAWDTEFKPDYFLNKLFYFFDPQFTWSNEIWIIVKRDSYL